MKKNLFFIAMVIVMAMTSCSESMLDLEEMSLQPEPDREIPGFFLPTDDPEFVEVFSKDSMSIAYTDSPLGLKAQDSIRVAGTEGIEATESLVKVAAEKVSFHYNYDIVNTVSVEGLTMPFTYEGVEYIIPCGVELTVSGFHNVVETSNEQGFYELSETNYILSYGELELAGATQVFVVEEGYVPPTVDHIDWAYRHEAFRREATISNNTINVFCDNVADFVQVMSDSSRQNEESVDYVVVNRFTASVPEIQATAEDAVVGNTYDFVNGEVTVCGSRISAQHISAEVEGSVMYQGKDYASEITPCEAAARTITFTSASEAVIRFYDEDSEDYAEATISVIVVPYEEPVTVVDVARAYQHVAFRPQAVVANNTISVVCDNEAVQTTTMSDGTSSKASADYTWTNRFVYSMPSIPASVKGQSFQFNAGTAVVEGYNVTVNFSSREVSAIMFNGTDYRSEAPVCEVNVATITFGEGSATITFEHETEEISATVPVNYIEAEIINGEIMGMWITDAYQGRSLMSTDLHILARNNDGSYTVYSRGVNETSFTTTQLTAAEGQSILSSGRSIAWVWTGASWVIGTMYYETSSNADLGYRIDYYDLAGGLALRLGVMEGTINGEPFPEPLKATGIAENGMWTISYNGNNHYFVGTINM